MVSQSAEYALRAMVWLAAHTESPLTTEQIAEATGVPASYLSKIMQILGRAKLVNSQPGPRGGFRLASQPEEVSILTVVNAVDPIERIRECPLHLRQHKLRLCPLHYRLDAARALVEDAFRGCSLADVLQECGDDPPLCQGD